MEEVTISTELMSAVMGVECKAVELNHDTIMNKIRGGARSCDIAYYSNKWHIINKYEFMHRCKKYVFRSSKYSFTSGIARAIHGRHNNTIGDGVVSIGFQYVFGKTEFEAVIKATQWVIDQKDKQ